jgi:hypothetical protein
MEAFIASSPDPWNEDIGVKGSRRRGRLRHGDAV